MKSYLPVARAAAIARCEPEDLQLLCQAGRVDCRQTNEQWFVAEEEIVDTLSMMNREVLNRELVDLREKAKHEMSLQTTEEASRKLAVTTALIILVLFGTMSVLALGVTIADQGGFAHAFDTFSKNLAAIGALF